MPEDQSQIVEAPLFPLSEFYARTSLALPTFEPVEGTAMPEPYRSLLVHNSDMTSTLERFHGGEICIHALSSEKKDGDYFREVVLCRVSDDKPVEFGAIRIDLTHFTPEARWMILQEKVPLGRILNEHGMTYSVRPLGFFRIDPDATIARALKLPAPVSLFGRQAALSDEKGRLLSQVIEILPLASLTRPLKSA